ncbi:hypothetical protein GCM10009784_22500 [Arthrobacter parietis]|uniref:Uncharacterized protein n=1 Tax=Arthrobacter parietis TaxID=271434 RepID=A0ABN3AYQ8_9MICC
MTVTGDLTIPLPDRPHFVAHLVVITRFLAALCWLGVVVTLEIMTSGALSLLVTPLILTAAAFWAARYRRGRIFSARPADSDRTGHEAMNVPRFAPGKAVMVPVYYAAVLSWACVAAVLFRGSNGAAVLVALPLLATLGAYMANKHLKRLLAETSAQEA